MATVKGFKAIRYNPEKVGDFAKVLAPPYDVINKEEQEELFEKDPRNVVRLILPKGDGDSKYELAAKTFRSWLAEGVLMQDAEESIYPYYQEFEEKGRRLTRKGFIAVVKLEDFSTKTILPHERTFPKHKQDRMKLTTACTANMSPVFSVYSDPEGVVEKAIDSTLSGDPIFEVEGNEGVLNKMWQVSDQSLLKLVKETMAEKSLLIADGHHRYETALEYRNKRREDSGNGTGEEPYEYVMMFLSRGEDEGLVINPTHRVVKNLNGLSEQDFLDKLGEEFEIRKMPFDEAVSGIGDRKFTLLLGGSGDAYRVTPKESARESGRDLGVIALHTNVFNKIIDEDSAGILYSKYLDETVGLVRSGEYKLAFILPELKAGDIFEVVSSGDRMPHKTTYFYPKILSGLTFNPLW